MDKNKFSIEELKKIIKADDLKISPFREDGKTYGTPTWIWAVEVDGELFVRAYNGTRSKWYNAAITQKSGQIHAAGMVKNVVFEIVNADLQNQIDEAYKTKYNESPYLPPMLDERAKEATIKISPE